MIHSNLDLRIQESFNIIKRVLKETKVPLIINYSGGKDSSVLLDLAQKVTDNFVCCFAISGIEFMEAIKFVEKSCKARGVKLLFSSPYDYKGGFFERLAQFRRFPTIQSPWCKRDLKFRPQKRMLEREFGKPNTFFKLNGTRRFESTRRRKIYASSAYQNFVRKDFDVSRDFMVFPILNWTDQNVLDYLEKEKLRIEPNPLYEEFGVSGCYWCVFYQPKIYRRILYKRPNLYDRFIRWEGKLNAPSVNGYVWLRDLKKEVQIQRQLIPNSLNIS